MTGLGGKISMLSIGLRVDQVAQGKSGTHVGHIGQDTTRGVEDSIVDHTSKSTLFKGGENVGNDTLLEKRAHLY